MSEQKSTGMVPWGNAALDKFTDPGKRLRALLEAMKPKVMEAIPKHLDAGTIVEVFLSEAIRKPELYNCTPESIINSLMTAAELGLPPSGPLGQFYLIPRRNKQLAKMYKNDAVRECTYIIGYKGYCELVRRHPSVTSIHAAVVYKDEVDKGMFTYVQVPPNLEHKWGLDDIDVADDQIVAAYCRVTFDRGEPAILVMKLPEIMKHRERSNAWQTHERAIKEHWDYPPDCPWVTDFADMCRKTAIRKLLNNGEVPVSREMSVAIDKDRDFAPVVDVVATERERTQMPSKKAAPTLPEHNPLADVILGQMAQPQPDPAPSPTARATVNGRTFEQGPDSEWLDVETGEVTAALPEQAPGEPGQGGLAL